MRQSCLLCLAVALFGVACAQSNVPFPPTANTITAGAMGPNAAQLDTSSYAAGYAPTDNNTLPRWSGFINVVNGTQLADQQCKRFPVLGPNTYVAHLWESQNSIPRSAGLDLLILSACSMFAELLQTPSASEHTLLTCLLTRSLTQALDLTAGSCLRRLRASSPHLQACRPTLTV